MPSLSAFVVLLVYIVIALGVGVLITWAIDWLGTPDQPAKILKVITWAIVGAIVILRLLAFAGIN